MRCLMVYPPKELAMATAYDFNAVDIDGNPVSLGDYRGKALLIVNVASLM